MERVSISKRLKQSLDDNPSYQQVYEFVKKYSQGNIWVIGGTVFRNIANLFYGTPLAQPDYDFIVEQDLPIENPEGWNFIHTRFGNPRLKKAGLSIDLIPLYNVDFIKRNKLELLINNFLLGSPLTVQSICFDTQSGQVIGDVGINAILSKTVGINNLEETQLYTSRLGISVNDFILEKAYSLGFTPILIS